MASFRIRSADIARDRDAFLSFIMGSQHYEHAFEPNRRLDPPVAEEHLTALLKRCTEQPSRILVAEDGVGTAIGWGVAFEWMDDVYVLEPERRHVYIAELFVEEAWRGKGVGTALIAAFEDFGRARGVRVMQLGVLPGNARAKAVYGKAGYASYALQLRKYL